MPPPSARADRAGSSPSRRTAPATAGEHASVVQLRRNRPQLTAPPARMSSTTGARSCACRSALHAMACRSGAPPLPARLSAAAPLVEGCSASPSAPGHAQRILHGSKAASAKLERAQVGHVAPLWVGLPASSSFSNLRSHCGSISRKLAGPPIRRSWDCALSLRVILHCPISDPALLERFVEDCLQRGVALVAVVGPGCEAVHDALDDLIIGDGANGTRFIVTTWHEDETLEEVRKFASAGAANANVEEFWL